MYKKLESALQEQGITIFGKTPVLKFDSPLEIRTWLRVHAIKNDKFVSTDDDFHKDDYEKYGLGAFLVQTQYFCTSETDGGLQRKNLDEIDRIMMV